MTKDEAMKLALEALETLPAGSSYKTHNAASALRQALERPQTPDDLLRQSEREGWRHAKECGAEVKRLRQALEQSNDAAWAKHLKEPMSEKCIQEGNTIVPSDYSDKAGGYTEQEPVYAFRRKGLDDFCTCDKRRYDELASKPNLFEVAVFYTAPPKREWVGLTDKEIQQVVYDLGTIGDLSHDEFDIARAVAQALKERNT